MPGDQPSAQPAQPAKKHALDRMAFFKARALENHEKAIFTNHADDLQAFEKNRDEDLKMAAEKKAETLKSSGEEFEELFEAARARAAASEAPGASQPQK
ncbi:hypothetical protein FALBO_9039 [Fusarium albosuccineum]|uniref:Uncharacterized protein n=1 Tax=Fusarium albosuccineum TaxID=1237068 RepID=A0A8H4L8I6_9HYPO|nr:hypothetical protein FALBO_9039 [Fusarium albosuccineum]